MPGVHKEGRAKEKFASKEASPLPDITTTVGQNPFKYVEHPSQLLSTLMMDGFEDNHLLELDPRQFETLQLEMLIESLTRNKDNWRMGGELLKWLASWQITLPNSVYLRVLSSYVENGTLKEAIGFLCSLRYPRQPEKSAIACSQDRNSELPSAAYLTILRFAVQEENWDAMRAVWETITEDTVHLSLHDYTSVIVAHTRAGDWIAAVKVFKTMWKLGINPDAVAYSALLQALRLGKQYDLIEHTLKSMKTVGIEPNARAHAIVLDSLLDRRMWREATNYFYNCRVSASGSSLSSYAYITLIRSLGKAGKVSLAEEIFSESPRGDPQITSAMLSAYKAQGNSVKAAELLKMMISDGLHVRTVDCNLVLSAILKSRGSITTARSIFMQMRNVTLRNVASQKIYGIKADDLGSLKRTRSNIKEVFHSEMVVAADKISYEIMQHILAREGEIEAVEALSKEMLLLGFQYSSYALCARMKAYAPSILAKPCRHFYLGYLLTMTIGE